MVYLCSPPYSHAAFHFVTAASWLKLQKTTSPGTCTGATHSKAVGLSRYHDIGHSYRS